MELILPVEVPAAALADHEAGRRAELLDRLRADAYAAAAADRSRRHHGHRHAAARLENAVVAREHAGGQLLRARRALGAHDRELLLDGGELLAYDRLVLPGLFFPGLEALLGVLDVDGEPLLHLHQAEDLLLGLRLLLLGFLDLEQDGGVFLVGLHLVEPGLELLALEVGDLEVLFLGAEVFPGRVDLGLDRLDRLLRLGQRRLERLDLPRQPGRFALEAADAGVEALKIYERLQLCVHDVSVVGMITIDCDPHPHPSMTTVDREAEPHASMATVDCGAEPPPSISGHPRVKPISPSNTMVGPPGFEPRPFRL